MNDILDNIPRTALYIRVSTDEQALHGYSLEAQKESLTAYAKANNLLVVGLYEDNGYTASKLKRPALQRLLLDVEAGKIDLIIFTKLDRWFRNVRDYYKIQTILEERKVNWRTAMESYDTTTANGRLHINIMLSVAQDECDRTSERIKAVFASKMAKGEMVNASSPIGYKIADKRLVIDPETAPMVVEAFEYYAIHQNLAITCRHLKESHGANLTPSILRAMLLNKRYIGENRDNKKFCEPIIPTDLFETVGIVLPKNIKATPTGYVPLFTGLLICTECGHKMGNYRSKGAGDARYQMYRCEAHCRNKTCSHSKSVNERKLVAYLLNNLPAKVEEEAAKIELKRNNPKTSTVKADREKLLRKIERLKDLYVNELIGLDELKKDKEKYQTQLSLLVDETEEPQVDIQSLRELVDSDYRTMYEDLTRKSKRAFWRQLLDRIEVDSDNNWTIFFR